MFTPLRKNFSNSFIYLYSLIAFILMSLIVILFPLELSSYRNSDAWAPFWNLITETGGFSSGIILLLILILILVRHFRISYRKISDLNYFLSIVFLIFVFSMGFSQFYLKDYFKKPRPYQLYFVGKGILINKGEQFFSMPGKEKSKFLDDITRKNPELINEVYLPVLNNWIYNSGFSFPSGHAQTSFYFAVIFSYVFFKIFKKEKKYLTLFPLIWAILVSLSRVILGFHYPADIAAGALAGMTTGLIAISLPVSIKIFRE